MIKKLKFFPRVTSPGNKWWVGPVIAILDTDAKTVNVSIHYGAADADQAGQPRDQGPWMHLQFLEQGHLLLEVSDILSIMTVDGKTEPTDNVDITNWPSENWNIIEDADAIMPVLRTDGNVRR